MRVIVAGAGTVGSNIARFLMQEGHEVIVIDLKRQSIATIEDELDVQTIAGNACEPQLLKEAGIEECDLFLAVTERDETNLLSAFAAKKLGCKKVVARVRGRFYYDTSEVNFRGPLEIDLLISPEILAATQLERFVDAPSALAQVSLARGSILLQTVKLSAKSKYVGKKLKDIQVPEGALVAGLRRGDEVMIARGNTDLLEDDRVTLIGQPDILRKVAYNFNLELGRDDESSVVIAGAGETGLYLAELLEQNHHRVTLLERDRARAEFVGGRLRNARVLHADATEINTLREERIGSNEYFIAAMGDDEDNIMSSLLAKELGVPKTACLIDRPDYARIVEKIGIDIAISPRIVVANQVLSMVKRGRIRSVTLLEDGELEIVEFKALSTSPIVGQPLKDIQLPDDVLIGAMVDSGRVVIPRGDTIIKPGTIVIGISGTRSAEKLENLFAAREKEEQ